MTKLREELHESESFLANVGRCITSWAYIEEKLFELCFIALKAPRKQASIVYYKTPSIEARLSLVEELVAALLPIRKSGEHATQTEIDWGKITLELRDLLPERNAMAHRPISVTVVLSVPKEETEAEFKARRKISVHQHPDEVLRGKSTKVGEMSADMLPAHLDRVRALEVELFNFKPALRKAISLEFP